MKIIMPKLGFDMSVGKVVRWLKKEGDRVRKGEAVLEIETDKATVEVQADTDGVLGKILVMEGDVPVGEPVGEIVAAGEPVTSAQTAVSSPAAQERGAAAQTPSGGAGKGAKESAKVASANGKERIDASPLARRMASELAIDLSVVKGSGPD